MDKYLIFVRGGSRTIDPTAGRGCYCLTIQTAVEHVGRAVADVIVREQVTPSYRVHDVRHHGEHGDQMSSMTPFAKVIEHLSDQINVMIGPC